jgi:hypothetical protein
MRRDLTETKRAVLETIRMRLSEKQALAYLEGTGHTMKRSMYYKHKAELESKKLERLHFIAMMGFEDQHLERIDTCELIAKLHWQNYLMEQSPYKKSLILKEIKELQPYISTYYEATKSVIEPANGTRQDNTGLPEDNDDSIPEIE